jgi:uncharacterized protein (TIGR00369 family)
MAQRGERDAEILQKRRAELVVLFATAPMKRTFGMSFGYEGDCAAFVLPYNPSLNHALGGVHGGVIATLIDNAGWFTAAAYYDTWLSTVDLNVRLLEPVRGEDLEARGKMVRSGDRLAMTDMEVRTAKGQLVATGTGTFAVTETPYTTAVQGMGTARLS